MQLGLAPIILLVYSTTSGFCYFAAFLSGLYLDCLTGSPRLGFIALSMLVSLRMLYPWRLYFFKDSITTLPVMTYLFAVLSTLIQCFLALILDIPSPITSLRLAISEVFVMPLLDVIWGVLAFMIVPQLGKMIVKTRTRNT